MKLNPERVPAGLSWGGRGFRIGKSVSGNWWISIGFPFGFRYVWFLGRNKSNRKNMHYPESLIKQTEHREPLIAKVDSDIVSRINKNSYSKIKNVKNKGSNLF